MNVGRIKEPGAFLSRKSDIAAYERLWEGPGLRCDFSNTYFFSETAAEGIRRYNPAARICITVREPVSRLVSQYMFMRRNGRFDGPIDEAIVAHPEILDRCRYASHAERWLARFPRAQILVLRLETLRADPDRYRKALFGFLGVADHAAFVPAAQAQAAALPRSRRLARGTKETCRPGAPGAAFRPARLASNARRSPACCIGRCRTRTSASTWTRFRLASGPSCEEEYGSFVAMVSRLQGLQIV